MPRLDRAADICDALGLELYVGHPRPATREVENLRLKAPDGETGAGPPHEDSIPDVAPLWLNDLYAKLSRDLREARDRLMQDETGTRHVEVRELAAAAGGGALELDETVTSRIAFRRDWLDQHGIDPTQCTVIGVEGESMEPTLPDGCSILVDRSRRRRRVGRIFVARLPVDGLVVKRLDKDKAGGWLLGSDHPEWDPVPWSDDADVIGEVRWVARTFR